MVRKYLIDTSIWMDLYEDRTGFNGEPLGEYALKLISMIFMKNQIIIISDVLLKELGSYYSVSEINGIFSPFNKLVEKHLVTKAESIEAELLARERNLPSGDVIHAVLARNLNAILVTRDNHFKKLMDISMYYTPEDLI